MGALFLYSCSSYNVTAAPMQTLSELISRSDIFFVQASFASSEQSVSFLSLRLFRCNLLSILVEISMTLCLCNLFYNRHPHTVFRYCDSFHNDL